MQEKLILNDGTELTGHVIRSYLTLFVYVYESKMAEIFGLLNDPEKTAVIMAFADTEETEYTGFSHLKSVTEESDIMISAVLRREVNE